ncbi:hypothetical protein NHX12_020032 [Muraenolepis orangiensis]|uniref:Uncharacterized protein n=1 Tax=Muraenolepis orangiensis TaxID=630683 RepID=A0A9Q0EXW7_9TELE|nr:hypothetical protein NHX12_020032 [Muraenolepis orangiensis]
MKDDKRFNELPQTRNQRETLQYTRHRRRERAEQNTGQTPGDSDWGGGGGFNLKVGLGGGGWFLICKNGSAPLPRLLAPE